MADRILQFVGGLDCGGAQSMILELYKNIDRNSIQFDFVIDHPGMKQLAPEVEALGGRIFELPKPTILGFFKFTSAWDCFFTQHPEYKVIHSHVRTYAVFVLAIARMHGLTTIIHSHSISNGKCLKSWIGNVLQLPLRRMCDYLFACSYDAGKWLFGKNVYERKNFYIIKNGIDLRRFSYQPKVRDVIREKYNLQDKFVLCTTGRFTSEKNPYGIISIIDALRKVKEDIVFLWIGDGPMFEEIVEEVRKKRLDDVICFLGARKDVNCVLQAADCFILPSLWEGLGIAAIEAQAVGLPCFCSDGCPEDVIVTDNCERIPIHSTELWIKKIVNCISNIRVDKTVDLVKNGYDAGQNAMWIQNFYLSILTQNKKQSRGQI